MSGKSRKSYSPEEKVAMLRRHLVEQVPISKICEENGVEVSIFYRWQKQFFENGAAAFNKTERKNGNEVTQLEEKVSKLEEKLQRKNDVLSELMEEHVKIKKELGEI